MPQGQTSAPAPDWDPAAPAALRSLLRSWRLKIWVGLQLGLAIVLVRQPLFGVLGLELASAVAVPASLCGLNLGVAMGRRAVATRASALARARDPLPLIFAVWWRAAVVAALVTALPAVLAAFNGLRKPTCDWPFGIRAYLSLPTASALLFAGAGVAIGFLTGPRRGLGALAQIVLVLGLAVAALARFLGEPPVFFYSPLIGYHPGNLYDENVRIGLPLYAARAELLAWVLAGLAAVTALLDAPTLRPRLRERRPARGRWPERVLAPVALAAGLTLRLFAGDLGYAIDGAYIQAALGGRIETEHFVIHYADRPDIAAEMQLVADDHELRLHQVARTLELDAAALARFTGAGRIRSYYFADRAQKAALMGARDVEMAKPWRREIYLTHRGFPHGSLRHEIVHVVAGEFGDPWFATSARPVLGMPVLFNPALIEGIAVAVDWPGRYENALTPHQSVRALEAMGLRPSVDDLMTLGFFASSSARSYTTAGSFVRYLLDHHGATALRRLYRSGGDFVDAYGMPLGELVAGWRAMLATIPLADAEVEVVRERFRQGAVFSRPCPHAIAARRADAVEARRRGDRAGALVLLRQVCADDGGEPRFRLDLAGVLAGGRAVERAEAIAIYRVIAADAERVTSSLRAEALEQLAELAATARQWGHAEVLLATAAALPQDDDPARQVEAKLYALRHRGPSGAALRAYFFPASIEAPAAAAEDGWDPQLTWTHVAAAVEPADGFGWYLRGLQRALRGDHAGAAVDLEAALARPLPSPRFARNAARRLALSAWRAGDRARVELGAARLAAAGMSEMDHLLAADWRDRLAFTAE